MASDPSFYVTTAIDYVNGAPHLGHAYEKITTDVIARWQRLCGADVRFLTGTDEHGIKIERTAADAGQTPQEFVDGLVPAFEQAWAALDISHDRFIRTTDADHIAAVQRLFEAIHDRGHLVEKPYEGWYCEGCEAFKTDKDLVGGKCPEHPSRDPAWLEEENLFFKLSAFQQPLLDLYENNPEWLQPESRRNEVLAMIRKGLDDLSVSRSNRSVTWGIPISFRPESVIYVWFDALINYLTGAGYGTDDELFARRWPADLHVIGKDITRFHCIIWPAMLMAAGVELPRRVFAHGWVTVGGSKLSKSEGNAEEQPRDLSIQGIAGQYGPDALRWFLVHDVGFGRDGEFSWDAFEGTYNGHLANGLGNLLSRSVSMAVKYFGAVPTPSQPEPDLHDVVAATVAEATAAYDELRLHDAAAAIRKLVAHCDGVISARAPWAMAKDEEQRQALSDLIYGLLEAVRIAGVLASPIVSTKAPAMAAALGLSGEPSTADLAWGGMTAGAELVKPKPLFPRFDQLG